MPNKSLHKDKITRCARKFACEKSARYTDIVMDNISKYGNLSQFFGCYFHQDFIDEFGSADEALNEFLCTAEKSLIKDTIEELNQFLSLKLGETELKKKLGSLFCDYIPESDNLSINEWLVKIRAAMVNNST